MNNPARSCALGQPLEPKASSLDHVVWSRTWSAHDFSSSFVIFTAIDFSARTSMNIQITITPLAAILIAAVAPGTHLSGAALRLVANSSPFLLLLAVWIASMFTIRERRR
jgi:hypothetical protein